MSRLIDADKLLVDLENLTIYGRDIHDFLKVKVIKQPTINEVEYCIANQPTIDVEPVRHGNWIMKKTPTGAPYTVCSNCNTSVKYNDEDGMVVMDLKGAKYCPNCGAKMDEVEDVKE